MKEILRITHIDLDGISPYILDRYYNPNYKDEDYIFINYGEEYKTSPENWTGEKGEHDLWLPTDYEKVVVTDLGLTEDYYAWLKQYYPGSYIWLDHHLDTERNGAGDDCVIYDLNSSGTKLYHNYLTQGKRKKRIVREFTDLVDCYDRFDKTSHLWEEAQNLNRLLWGSGNYKAGFDAPITMKFKFFINSQIQKFHFSDKFFFSDSEENIIQRQIEKEDTEYAKAESSMLVRTDNAGYKFGLIQCGSKVSMVCNKLLEEHDNIDYVICINTFKGVNGRMHLRISENSDIVSDYFDGFKGHAKAAGGSLDKQQIVKLWSNRLNYHNYIEERKEE